MAYIKIDSKNLIHNLKLLVEKCGDIDRVAVVLKDNAYGHGLVEIAEICSNFGIKEAVVADLREAEVIKNLFNQILILGGGEIKEDEKFSFAINNFNDLKTLPNNIKIELKVDTGMHRNGISFKNLKDALEVIKKRKVSLFGVMSHHRSGDELSSEYFWQKKRFEEVKRITLEAGFEGVRFHSQNSAGVLRCEKFDEDIARVGIAIYGYSPLPKIFGEFGLLPVLSLWAKRVSTKWLNVGDRVGYGGDFVVREEGLYSTYDLGYGDGWPRGDSRNPYKTAVGEAIIGRVSMDFITIRGNREEICVMSSAEEASNHFGTISYEMVTRLSPHLTRIVL
jgi:alanine racemase